MLAEIRRCTHTGRPLGSTEFVQALEGSTKRRLAPQKGGAPFLRNTSIKGRAN